MELSLALNSVPIDEKWRLEIDKSIIVLGECLAQCERIFTTPVPLIYTRHTARFNSIWMIMIPFALYDAFVGPIGPGGVGLPEELRGLMVVLIAAMLAVFLFGIEELAIQLEEPFTILPMDRFCEEIRDNAVTMRDRSVQYWTDERERGP